MSASGIENISLIRIQTICEVNGNSFYLSDLDNFVQTGDGIWSYDPAFNRVTLEAGKQYYFYCYINSESSGCYTYPLLFNTACLGDTAFFTGDETEVIYGEGTIFQKEIKWRSSALGPLKQIDRYGNVTGETVPYGGTDYDLFLNYMKKNNYNITGMTAQKFFDNIAIALGLTEDDVERAITESNRNPGWYRYFSLISGGAEDYSDRDVIYVDVSAMSDLMGNIYQCNCYTGDGTAPVIRINENTMVLNLDVKSANSSGMSSTSYTAKPYRKSIYIYTNGYNNGSYFSLMTMSCYADPTCYGDTLVIDPDKVKVVTANTYGESTVNERYPVHWKNHDNTVYGAVRCFDEDYNIIGDAQPDFGDRCRLLNTYIYGILPKIRNTVIETDQELIDMQADELGMKKDDVIYMLGNSNSMWTPEDSDLPDGYSYDVGTMYLKAITEDKPQGNYSFVLDTVSGLYIANGYVSGITRYSSVSSSSGSSEYVYKPVPKYEVVRYEGGSTFTTVSHTPISALNASLYFFRPQGDYCFGYNTGVEMASSSSGSSSSYWPPTEEFPLTPPSITSVKSEVDGLNIKWNAVDGAVRYRAFVKGDNDWVAIGDTTGTTLTYSGCVSGNAYTFTVRCVSAAGSAYLSRFTENSGVSGHYVAAPNVVSIHPLAEGNELTWNPVGGNAKYRVFVKSGKNWKALGDTFDTSYIHSSQGDTSIYAQPGVTYTYTVACISINGQAVTSGYNKTGWTQTYTAQEEEPVYKVPLGDTDGDGMLTSCDATYIQRKVAGIEIPFTLITAVADTDGDGELTVMDASNVQRKLAGLKTNYKVGEPIT